MSPIEKSSIEFLSEIVKNKNCQIKTTSHGRYKILNSDGTELSKNQINELSKHIYSSHHLDSKKSKAKFLKDIKKLENISEGQLSKILHKTAKKYEILVKGRELYHPKHGHHIDRRITKHLESRLEKGKTRLGTSKPLRTSSLSPPVGVEPKPFPEAWLVRILTGDVKSEWIKGTGKMKESKGGPNPESPPRLSPAEGYGTVFVSDTKKYKERGLDLTPPKDEETEKTVDINNVIEALDLKDSDAEKVRQHGAWVMLIHPGIPLAIPTQRQSEWNPKYKEGGYTASGQQEWVALNIPVAKEALAGNIRIFKIDPKDGKMNEWKVFVGDKKLYPIDVYEEKVKEMAKHHHEKHKKVESRPDSPTPMELS